MRTAVLALGGNALARSDEPATVTNQFRHARESVAPIVELARQGWRIVIVHGNGPQVGDELVRNEAARKVVEPLPLGVLVAETAGWIGYMLQQSLQNALAAARVRARGRHRHHPDAGRPLRSGAESADQTDRPRRHSPGGRPHSRSRASGR